jgi:hypothetical protein
VPRATPTTSQMPLFIFMLSYNYSLFITLNLMNYARKGGARDKRMIGCCNMIGQQDDVFVIILFVRSSATLSVRSADPLTQYTVGE